MGQALDPVLQRSAMVDSNGMVTREWLRYFDAINSLLQPMAQGFLLQTFKGTWSSSTRYNPGDEVAYNSFVWQATATNTNSAPATGNGNWLQLAPNTMQNYQGAWSSGTTYQPGMEVGYSGQLWQANNANLNSPPSSTNANWVLVGITSVANFTGAWNSSTSYIDGQTVSYDNYVWSCILNNVNQVPSLTSPYWVLVSPATLQDFQGTWSGGTTYQAGMEVLYSSYVYKSLINNNVGNTPGVGASTSAWQCLSPSSFQNYQGAWNAGIYYAVGMSVDYASNIYQCIVANSGQTPSSSSSYWVLVGPDTLDNVADGPTYKKPVGVNGSNQTTTATYASGSLSSAFSQSSSSASVPDGASTNTAYEIIGPINIPTYSGFATYIISFGCTGVVNNIGSVNGAFYVCIDGNIIASYIIGAGSFVGESVNLNIPITIWQTTPSSHGVSIEYINESGNGSAQDFSNLYLNVLVIKA